MFYALGRFIKSLFSKRHSADDCIPTQNQQSTPTPKVPTPQAKPAPKNTPKQAAKKDVRKRTHEVPQMLFGPELEGGEWPSCAQSYLIDDSTVQTGSHDDGECRPITALSHRKAKEFILSHYPKNVNETCGFHIHVSFGKNQDRWLYVLIGSDFYKFFTREAKKFCKTLNNARDRERLTERMNGYHGYVVNDTNLEARLLGRGGYKVRECLLNYKQATGTVEVRMAPMFASKKTAARYLDWLSKTLKKHFREHGPLSKKQLAMMKSCGEKSHGIIDI